jgi:hypothetical protein
MRGIPEPGSTLDDAFVVARAFVGTLAGSLRIHAQAVGAAFGIAGRTCTNPAPTRQRFLDVVKTVAPRGAAFDRPCSAGVFLGAFAPAAASPIFGCL